MVRLEQSADKAEDLRLMVESARAMTEGEEDSICVLANISAVVKAYLPDINWAGFYIRRGEQLVLGPFQGLPACTRIEMGKGVCGTAAAEARSVVVEDVHGFPGHIACDAASNSEMVVPLFRGGEVWGVLDVDSPLFSRFGPDEQEALDAVGGLIDAFLDTI